MPLQYLICVPESLYRLWEISAIIHDCINTTARELRFVAKNHISTMWHIFLEEVEEPHAWIAFPPPRPIRMSAQAGNGNNNIRPCISDIHTNCGKGTVHGSNRAS